MWKASLHVVGLVFAVVSVEAQVPTIVKEIGDLENVRDPKCYATANRLEDFIYGTPLEAGARFEKIALQKRLIRDAGRIPVERDTLYREIARSQLGEPALAGV